MDIRSLDLNLLPVLHALLREQGVTRAARELGMSQSALSSALARLREALGDPLFVRTGRGMLPTPRAQALAEPLEAMLAQVQAMWLAGGGFDPARSSRRFTLCLSDVGSYVLWPRILTHLAARAPALRPRLVTLAPEAIPAALEDGQVDLAVGAYATLPGTLLQRRLFDRDYVAFMRAGHPLARGRLGASRFARAEHVRVRQSSGIQTRVDDALAALGLARERVTELPSYLMLAPLVAASEVLAVVPAQLADAFNLHGGYATRALPLDLPRSTIRVHWHRRFHDDAGNAWLRGELAGLFAQAGEPIR